MKLKQPEYSYLLGFLHADGTSSESTRNRGKIQIELNDKDRDICEAFKQLVPQSKLGGRTRDTNFKNDYNTVIWSVFDWKFRQDLKKWGMPVGRKSDTVTFPRGVSVPNYFRGYIDGDGSLGFTANKFPFVSLVISSDSIKRMYLMVLKQVTGKIRTTSRNKRDGIYNICVTKEDAQALVRYLYPSGCLALKRKAKAATQILKWKRPKGMKKIENRKYWNTEEDAIVLSADLKDAMKVLGRSEKSIKSRKWRLTHAL